MLDLHGVHLPDTTAYASTTSCFGAHSGIRFLTSVVENMGVLQFLTSYPITLMFHDGREEHTSLEMETDETSS